MRRSLSWFQASISSSQIKNLLTLELNQPKVLNAIGLQEVRQLNDVLVRINAAETNNNVGAYLIKGHGKAFCAGGDVKSIWRELEKLVAVNKQEDIGTGKKGHYHTDFFREEYIVNHRMANSTVPQISIWNGIVMGGGVGISVFGDFRIATEKAMFALPETALGLFPDVGCSGWLPHVAMDKECILKEHGRDIADAISQKDDGVGMYIGLTGCRLNAFDLLQTGIATHLVQSSELDALESALSKIDMTLDAPDAARKGIRSTLKSFLYSPQPSHIKDTDAVPVFAPSTIIPKAPFIARCFGNNAASVEEIMSRLTAETAAEAVGSTDASREWATKTLHSLSKMSPTGLKVTFTQLTRGRQMLDLKSCLTMEFRAMQRCMKGDFREGVRALLVDKDPAGPQWQPATLEGVSKEMVEEFFSPLDFDSVELFGADSNDIDR